MPEQNGHADEGLYTSMPAPQFNGDHPILSEPKEPLDRTMSPAGDYSVAQEDIHDEERDFGRRGGPVVNVNVHTPPPPSPPIPAPQQQQQPQPSAAEVELSDRLNEAHAEIQRLRSLLASVPDPNAPELRRRTRALSDDSTIVSNDESDVGTYVDQGVMHPEGVPPQVVVLIALGVFVTTYIFF